MSGKVIVLLYGGAGGAGFSSAADKLSCPVLGRPLVSYVLETAARLGPASILLALDDRDVESAAALSGPAGAPAGRVPVSLLRLGGRKKGPSSGMAPALAAAMPALRKNRSRDLLAVPVDRPLLQPRTLKNLLSTHRRKGCSLTILCCGPELDRDSIAVFRVAELAPLLAGLARAGGKAGLGYLAATLAARGRKVGLTESRDADESLRISSRLDLARVTGLLHGRKNERLARRGVTFLDPLSAWIDWEVEVGAGTVIYPSVVIEGATRIGKNCRIYPHVHIMRSEVGDRVKILSSTVFEDSRLEDDAQVGPFSRLRPGTVIRASSKVGNFVEMKNTVFGPRSKAQHLSYLGDSLVEEDVNIGAGTITCNYDGVRKNRTHIGAGAFIGSGTELVAPVKIGKQAYVAAGSTITKDVGPASLAISRARQVEKPGWVMERLKKLQRKARAHK
jgi:bifunctional UDP-N-acetylglucosamine pyrophosphorylase/glucosamine-1-phosphate N-acetyltransferase